MLNIIISIVAQNVGIGTATPSFKLDVKNGSINTDSVYRIYKNIVITVVIGNCGMETYCCIVF